MDSLLGGEVRKGWLRFLVVELVEGFGMHIVRVAMYVTVVIGQMLRYFPWRMIVIYGKQATCSW